MTWKYQIKHEKQHTINKNTLMFKTLKDDSDDKGILLEIKATCG